MVSKFRCKLTRQMATQMNFRSTPAKSREEERLALLNELSVICPSESGIDIILSTWTISSPVTIYSTGCYRMGLMPEGWYEQIARSFPSSICQKMLWKSRDSFAQLSVESLPLLFGWKRNPYIHCPQLRIQPLLRQQCPGKAAMGKSSKCHAQLSSQSTTATWMG